MKKLENKNIVVFGSTGFIGQRLSKILSLSGANLIIHGKSKEKLEELNQSITTKNKKVISFHSDILSEKFYLELFRTVSSHFSHIDIMINLIGKFNGLKSITDLSHSEWNDLIEINLSSYWRIVKELNSLLGGESKTKIIYLSNRIIRQGKAYHHSFSLAKNALSTLVNLLNNEKKKLGIQAILVDVEKLNIGMTSLIRGQDMFEEEKLEVLIEKILSKL